MTTKPQVALVTGANKSIGLAVVSELASRGMTVYLGCRDLAAGREAAATLPASSDVRPILVDLKDETSLVETIATIQTEQDRLDILVNNAGVSPGGGGAVDCPEEQIALAMQVNCHGPARVIQLAMPLLRKSKAARIVNVTSIAGSLSAIANPSGALAQAPVKPYAYCLSKASANAMTVLFADALAPEGIKVNAVNPGLVRSALSNFMGTRGPEDGAHVIVRYATMGDDCPTGGFFDEDGPLEW